VTQIRYILGFVFGSILSQCFLIAKQIEALLD
jgi:hypothetical protein